MKLYIQKNLLEVKASYSLRALVDRLGLQMNFKPQEVLWCRWKSAEQVAYMLNTDGSVQQNRSGYGGTIRDSLGNVVRYMRVAFVKELSHTSGNPSHCSWA
ncbi:hypothetical protein IFM89_026415 [Coptis chinensis]|uniref:Uncharacterized protein n=1 Tax=Coptis chinensis TaxID=261450 RepID=A0A835HQE5_9MAGN|nr:hypothetical protein IFM89_026415 [Coptis chinensis]